MPSDNDQLWHSVAFRVTESEWLKLQAIAEDNGMTIPQLAKELLFKSAGLHPSERKKSLYGHATAPTPRKRARR
jgi:hypothetical protein